MLPQNGLFSIVRWALRLNDECDENSIRDKRILSTIIIFSAAQRTLRFNMICKTLMWRSSQFIFANERFHSATVGNLQRADEIVDVSATLVRNDLL